LSEADIELVEQPGMMGTRRALDGGLIDVGLAFNLLTFHAVNNGEVLGHPTNAVAALTTGYNTPAQIVVPRDSDVRTVADLKGKRVSLGIPESGERFCSQLVLSHFGIEVADLRAEFLDFAPSLASLHAGRLDAYITWRGMPVPDLADAFNNGTLRLIPVDAPAVQGLRVKHPFLMPWTIPARVYAHQDAPVPAVSGRILLLASKSLSRDLVEQIMRAISAHMPDLIARHPAAANFNLTRRPTFEDGLSIDLHPGAEDFFQSLSVQR
jgi:TRAP transporter TAXI family solute receptor